MPRRAQVAITRQAISPRLAIRILLNMGSRSRATDAAAIGASKRCALALDAHRCTRRLAELPWVDRHIDSRRVRPIRLALVEKCRYAFASLGRHTDAGDARGGVENQGVAYRVSGDRADQRLAFALRHRAGSVQAADKSLDAVIQIFFAKHQFVDQSDTVGLGRVEAFGGEEITPRRALTNGRNHVRADHGGDE